MIEATGVKGLKSLPFRKTFKNEDALTAWAETHDAEVHAIRELDFVEVAFARKVR